MSALKIFAFGKFIAYDLSESVSISTAQTGVQPAIDNPCDNPPDPLNTSINFIKIVYNKRQ
jgi:hypothetical protein